MWNLPCFFSPSPSSGQPSARARGACASSTAIASGVIAIGLIGIGVASSIVPSCRRLRLLLLGLLGALDRVDDVLHPAVEQLHVDARHVLVLVEVVLGDLEALHG